MAQNGGSAEVVHDRESNCPSAQEADKKNGTSVLFNDIASVVL